MHLAPRLIKLAGQARISLLVSVLSGVLNAVLIVAQASLASTLIAVVFLERQGLAEASRPLAVLLGVAAARAGLTFLMEATARKAALQIKTSLRRSLFAHLIGLGPGYIRRQQSGELAVVVQEGVDGLDAYYSQYLPNLALAALVPLTILAAVSPLDLLSGFVLLVTAPLIPLFMVLIGRLAGRQTRRRWLALRRLSAHFLDAMQGLVTLKTLGRSLEHAAVIEQASQRHRQATMEVLRITFLSALALELIATLSTALLAVEIALRLLAGRLDFAPALMILFLAPEFFLPLRTLGLRYHAGESGVEASRRIFAILDEPAGGTAGSPDTRKNGIVPGSHAPLREIPLTIRGIRGSDFSLWDTLRFDQVGYTYPGSNLPALTRITFDLKAGQHAALTGPSGAGKSTVLSLLLRFAEPTEGVIRLDEIPLCAVDPHLWRDQVAWVPQTPHLFNGTLEENLRLARPNASTLQVRQAARSAGLDSWITALPLGYETPLSDLVSRLSAGEMQRLALARAFLRDAPLLLLDEHTAFLDPPLEDELRQTITRLTRGRTSLTIAHRLETLAHAYPILVLEASQLVETGTHAGLLRQQGLYSHLAGAGLPTSRALPVGGRFQLAQTPVASQPSIPGSLASDSPFPHGTAHTASHPPFPSGKGGQGGVGRAIRGSPLFRLLGFLRLYWKGVAGSTLVSLAAAACAVGLLGTAAYLLSSAALRPSIATLQVAIVGVRFFGLGRGVFRYLERLVSHEINFRVLAGMRVWFYRRLEPLAPARLFDTTSGDMLARAVGDISTLEDFYLRGMSPVLVALLVTAGMGVFLLQFGTFLAAAFTGFALLAGLALPAASRRMARRPARDEVEGRAALGSALVDALQGLPELEACNQGGALLEKLARLEQASSAAQARSASVLAWQAGLSALVFHLAGWTFLVLGIALVESGSISGVLLAALVISSQVALEAVLPLPQAAHQVEKSLQSARHLFALVDLPPEVMYDEKEQRRDAENAEIQAINSAFSASLRCFSDPVSLNIRRLTFRYAADLPAVFDGLDFELRPGEKVGLVGPSGVGKTTLISLLLRFWEFQHGSIELAGRPLRDYSPHEIHRLVSVLPARPYLFSTTLRQNLRLANPTADQAQLSASLDKACLGEWAATLPEGLETWVGEHGVRLSTGERQRLAFARLFLQDTPLVILDEPFANLDTLAAGKIWQAMLDHTRRRTLLVITHRLHGLETLDRIAVLRGGRIAKHC